MLRTIKREAIRFSPVICGSLMFLGLYMANVPGSSRYWGLLAILAGVLVMPAMIVSLEVSHKGGF
jgi:hypothetical protein